MPSHSKSDSKFLLTTTAWDGSPLRVTTASRHQSAGHTRSQDELKAQLELEIQDAVFKYDDIVTVFYGPVTRDQLAWIPSEQRVMELVEELFAHTSSERPSYPPLQQLFAKTTELIPNAKLTVVFSVYDRAVEDKPDGSGELKPDVTGTKEPIMDDERVPWRLIIIAVEVKADNNPGFIQCLTYARCMLAVGDKWFAPLLFYNHRNCTLYGVFVTRFGVFVTPKMPLKRPSGRIAMAEMLVRMCSNPGQCAALEPGKRIDDDGSLCLARGSALSPSLRTPAPANKWLTLELLSQRISIIGRATRVYRCSHFKSTLKKPEPRNNPKTISSKDDSEPADDVPDPALPRRTTRNPPAVAQNERPASAFVPNKEEPVDIKAWCKLMTTASADGHNASAGYLDAPPGTICRSAWLPLSRYDLDNVLVKELKGFHGCPLLQKTVVARHPAAFVELGKLFLAGKISRVGDFLWYYQTERPVKAAFQPMVQVYSFYTSVGSPIGTIVDQPIRLAHAVKDTMIGLTMVFLGHRRIHRDVTRTNLLVYAKRIEVTDGASRRSIEMLAKDWPEFRRVLEADSGFRKLFSERHAFVNDFEHAVVWDDLDRAINVARSGTPEYMSYQLLAHFVEGKFRPHTLLDDLESCIWVPFGEVLAKFPQLRTKTEEALFTTFATDNYKLVCYSKSHLLRLKPADREPRSALSSTWALWSRLLPIADDIQKTMVSYIHDYLEKESAVRQASRASGTPASASHEDNMAVLVKSLGELSRAAVIRYLLAIKDAIDELERDARKPRSEPRSEDLDDSDELFG